MDVMTASAPVGIRVDASVSAIVSAYFAEAYLEGRLRNLLSQQPQPEIVVICRRGSQEETIARDLLDVRLERSVDDPTVEAHRVIVTEDIPTIYAAWNMGIQAAHGTYLTNANSDDRLYPGALRKLTEVLDMRKRVAVAYFDVDVTQETDGLPIGRYEWLEGGLPELLTGCFLGPMPMWRKSLHLVHGLFDAEMHSAGDYEFWMRIAKAGEIFERIPQALGSYLMRNDSAERRHRLRSVWEQARAKARYREGVGIWKTPDLMTD